MKSFTVAVAGGSGSGKSYFVNKTKEQLGETAVLFSQDNFYKPKNQQPKDENGICNFDLPESILMDDFASSLEDLSNGKPVEINEYTFNNASQISRKLIIEARPILLVEGLFLLNSEEIARQLDLIVFVDAPDYIKLRRRIIRDQMERGYEISDVLYRFENHVMPSYKKYIELYKNKADIIVNNEKDCEKAIEVLVRFLKHQATWQPKKAN